MLKGRKILLGVTGSIAAYKAAILVRGLVKQGAQVRVVMTELAKQFITPLTMATLSKNPILVEFFDPENGQWNSHVSLGEWADAYLIAPATANTMAKMASGIADNLLLTTYLSARCHVFVAPAMDLDMFAHTTTSDNISKLRSHGVIFIEPEEGELASGLCGKGRMAEPDEIISVLDKYFAVKGDLHGKNFLVTAGPTVEAIDPVRYISNHSTGKMGYAIAGELAARGATVTLVSGPTNLSTPAGVNRIDVVSAAEMYTRTVTVFNSDDPTLRPDGAIMCAAVADYTPLESSGRKIKKTGDEDISLRLKTTKDIAAELGKIKGERIVVGFALETDNAIENARRKIETKNLDMIVLNSLEDKGAGFGIDTNKITIIDASGTAEDFPVLQKSEVASIIVDKIEKYLK